jgi:hypothetical protein
LRCFLPSFLPSCDGERRSHCGVGSRPLRQRPPHGLANWPLLVVGQHQPCPGGRGRHGLSQGPWFVSTVLRTTPLCAPTVHWGAQRARRGARPDRPKRGLKRPGAQQAQHSTAAARHWWQQQQQRGAHSGLKAHKEINTERKRLARGCDRNHLD